MYTYTIPAIKWDERNPNRTAILQLIQEHEKERSRLDQLLDYYTGNHKIMNDKERDYKLVCNHAKDISDTATAYFIGNPVTYNNNTGIKPLTDALEAAGADEADGDNGLDLSIYGRAYEFIYTREGEPELDIKNLDPRNTFLVRDDSIEERELFAVYYYIQKDDSNTTGHVHYIATILTTNYLWRFNICNIPEESSILEGPTPHFKGEVPIIEYLNNKLAIGDYELQIPLIDAYNALMSDRITDKEQFIDSILVIYGTLLSDEEEYTDDSENGVDGKNLAVMRRLAKRKLLEMPDEKSKAEYLTRTFDEAGVEILRKAIEQDIHKFSHIPCMTDEAFGGNVSGVAMEFKLLGMENITKIKTRYYRKGIRKRLRIFCNFLTAKSKASINPRTITATFTRAMPKNLLEISQYVMNLKGTVSKKTLLSQIPFVDDVDAELEAVEKESEEELKRQQDLFDISEARNDLPEKEDEVDEE